MTTPDRPPKDRDPIRFPVPASPLTPPPDFAARCDAFGVAFDDGELDRHGLFLAMLLEANALANLTAIRDPADAWMRHVFDALTILSVLPAEGDPGDDAASDGPPAAPTPTLRIADVGSGGGLPAIPLAIALPDARFTLIESTGKKAAFLRAAADALGLDNIEVLTARAELVGQEHRTHRGAYDAVTARAVGRINVVAELTLPLAKVGGRVILVKGERAEEELAEAKAALHLLHAAPAGVVPTPTGRLVVLEKLRATPRLYPRAVGEPKRRPLGP